MSKNDYNYEELIREYGAEFLVEHNYSDECPKDMEMLNEYTQYDALEAITRAFYGYRWTGIERDEPENFNPNDDYFAFNAYGNLISIPDYWYDEYLKSFIDEEEFVEWCVEQGYLDEDEDEEINGVGLVSALIPKYDSRASFYGKAQIDDHDDHISLYSYDIEVARYDKASGNLHVYGWYSATTARHIREFAYQLGITLPSGKDIEGVYHY